jgi:hypothetical protein
MLNNNKLKNIKKLVKIDQLEVCQIRSLQFTRGMKNGDSLMELVS